MRRNPWDQMLVDKLLSGYSSLDAARMYLVERRFAVVPIPQRSKAPRLSGWPDRNLTEDELHLHFGDNENIGVVLGDASNGLTDVDCDVVEARNIARKFLPATDLIHGRASNPGSHFFYRCDPLSKAEKFTDVDGTVLIELRSSGQQTVVPPSVHPSGERLEWERAGEPASIHPDDLRSAVARVATAALIARHYLAPGQRNDMANALAGMLLRGGIPENDVADLVSAAAEEAGDAEVFQRVRDVVSSAKRLSSGRTLTGGPTLAHLLGDAVVARIRQFLNIGSAFPPDQDHRVAEGRQWPEPLAAEALQGLAGDFARALDSHTESDQAALLIQFLAAFGNLVGRNAYFQVEGDQHFANLFVLIVGASSKARKGTSWSLIRKISSAVDAGWESTGIQSGLSSGEGLIWHVRDEIVKCATDDSGRTETKLVDEGVSDKRLLVFEAEFGSVLRITERPGNILSAVVRDAWDRGNIQSMTKNSPAKSTGAHISIVGHITVDELRRLLSATDTANGFANRFLFVAARRSKLLPEGGDFDEKNLGDLIPRLRHAVEFARTTTRLVRDEAARRIWIQVYERLSEGRLGMTGAVTSRAEAQVVRLSLIFALIDCSEFIRREHMLAALAVWEYCEATTEFIFGDSLGDVVADNILKALRESKEGLSRTQIRDLFQRNRAEAEIQRALGLLRQLGLVMMNNIETGGRPVERWTAVRVTTKTIDTTKIPSSSKI